MAVILKHEQFSTCEFSYSRVTKTLCAELSTLARGKQIPGMQPIYDDAADEGICLRSHVTGAIVRFYHSSTDDDSDGDVAGWRFLPIAEDVRKNPALKGLSMLIIND